MSQMVTEESATPAFGVPLSRRVRATRWINAHRPRSRWLNILLILLLVAAIVLAFLTIGNPGPTTTPVRTVAVTRGTVTARASGSGNTTSSVSTPVSFVTNGVVTELDVKAGDTVTVGQVLAKIDPTTANSSLRTAQAQLRSARAAYAQAAAGPTAVKRQQDQLAITQAQQGVAGADTTLAAADKQRDLDQTSTSSAIDKAQTTLRNDQDSTDTSVRTARTTLNADQQTLTRARNAVQATTSCGPHVNLGAASPPSTSTTATSTTATSTTATSTTSTSTPTAAAPSSTCSSDFATYKAAAATVARDKLSVTSAQQTQDATLDADRQAVTAAKQDQAQTLAKDDATIATDKQQLVTEQSSVTSSQLALQADLHPMTPDEIAQSKASVDSAQVTADTAQKAVGDTTLTAPQAGVVVAVDGKVGETSGSGSGSTSSTSSSGSASAASATSSSTGFVTIANLSRLAVTANIAEADAAKIKLGQAATVTFPATSTTATGSVTQITPQSTVTNNVVLYPVQVSLDTAPPGVGVGATATLSITTGSVDGVLEAPTSAITTVGNRHTVTLHRSTGTGAADTTDTVVPVEIGLSGDTTTEITSGVVAGDQLVLPTTGTAASTTGGFPRTGGG